MFRYYVCGIEPSIETVDGVDVRRFSCVYICVCQREREGESTRMCMCVHRIISMVCVFNGVPWSERVSVCVGCVW